MHVQARAAGLQQASCVRLSRLAIAVTLQISMALQATVGYVRCPSLTMARAANTLWGLLCQAEVHPSSFLKCPTRHYHFLHAKVVSPCSIIMRAVAFLLPLTRPSGLSAPETCGFCSRDLILRLL